MARVMRGKGRQIIPELKALLEPHVLERGHPQLPEEDGRGRCGPNPGDLPEGGDMKQLQLFAGLLGITIEDPAKRPHLAPVRRRRGAKC